MRILRRCWAVCEKLGGINGVTLWRITRDRSFPPALHINKRLSAGSEHEIDAWLEQRASRRVTPPDSPTSLAQVRKEATHGSHKPHLVSSGNTLRVPIYEPLIKKFGFQAAAILGLLELLDRAQDLPMQPLASRARVIADLEGG